MRRRGFGGALFLALWMLGGTAAALAQQAQPEYGPPALLAGPAVDANQDGEPRNGADPRTGAVGLAPRLPKASALIETHILPLARQFADETGQLQNLVIRVCQGATVPRQELLAGFVRASRAAGALQPLAFGSPISESAPEQLLTPATDTAYSTERLKAMMNARIPVPATLDELRTEEPALLGLPALERLLLAQRYGSDETLANRCQLAVPVAANIHETADAIERTWEGTGLVPHWSAETPELADRRRLRDLIQGMIDAADAVVRSLAEASEAGESAGGPFDEEALRLAHLDGKLATLAAQATLLRRFASEEGAPMDLVEVIIEALNEGINELAKRGATDVLPLTSLLTARDIIVDRLPEAFGFASTAFELPLTSFGIEQR